MGGFVQTLLTSSSNPSEVRKAIACIRGITRFLPLSISVSLTLILVLSCVLCRSHNPRLSLDYLEDELTAFYQSEASDPNTDPVEFRPAAEEHLRQLEALRLSQLLSVSTILDTHLGALVAALLEVCPEELDLELARELLVMMSDYVERQLPQLSSHSLVNFY
jgi:hypothetical protein